MGLPLGKQGHDQPDQEAAGDVDHHGADGKPGAEAAADGAAREVTRHRPRGAAQQDQEKPHRGRSEPAMGITRIPDTPRFPSPQSRRS